MRQEATGRILSTWHLEFRADQSLSSQFLHLWGNGKWHWSQQHFWEVLYTGWVAFGSCNFNWLVFFQSCTETISTFHQPELFGDIKQFLYKTRNLGREGRDHHERYRHHQWSSTRTSSQSKYFPKHRMPDSPRWVVWQRWWHSVSTDYVLLILFLKSQQQLCFCVHFTRSPILRSDWALAAYAVQQPFTSLWAGAFKGLVLCFHMSQSLTRLLCHELSLHFLSHHS